MSYRGYGGGGYGGGGYGTPNTPVDSVGGVQSRCLDHFYSSICRQRQL